MKFSYNWIRELVPALDVNPDELMRLITTKTAECEGLEHVGAPLESASLAHIVSVEWIEGSHNQVVAVDTARYGRKTVVCGAPNCRPGMRTIYLPLETAVIERRGKRRHAGERLGSQRHARSHRHRGSSTARCCRRLTP